MIRKHFLLLGLSLAAAVLLPGCTSDLQPSENDSGLPLRLSVSPTTGLTRASDGLYTSSSGFGGGERVEVYVNNSSKHGTYQVNSTTTTKLDALTGQEQYYPTSGDVSLYAVYPAASVKNGSHTVKYDQTSDDNYKASDLMYAKTTVSQADKSNEQQLQFGHQLVKLKVKIIKAAGVSAVTKVEMKNVKRRVSVSADISSMTLGTPASATGETGTGANTDKILVFSGSNTQTSTQTYAVVFPVQSWSNQDFITVTADNKEATYKLTKNDFTFGYEYTLTLNINAAALGNTVSIDTWSNGGSAVINPTASELSIDIDDPTYTGSALMPAFTIKDASGNTVATVPQNTSGDYSNFNITWQNNTNAGTATVAAVGKGTYAGKACATNFTINKGDATHTAPSKKTGLTYTGEAQALANEGSSSHGTFTYCATQNGTYTTTIPTGTNAGSSYAVYWKLTGDSNHNDASGSLTGISIAKATPSVTAPTAKPSLLYTGSALELINAGSTTAGCTMQYRLDGSSTWSSDATTIKGTAAQTYTVYYRVVGNNNYNDVAQQSITASIITSPLAAVTSADIGKVVCAAGHLHDAKTAVPAGCTAVGVLGKVTSTGHGLIVALKDAKDQTWNTINGWASITSYASTTLKLLPDNTARGTLSSYTDLGGYPVSNWCVGQKTDYEPIMKNLGSAKYDSDGYTYDANVNAYFTSGSNGDAFDGYYWSATELDSGHGWYFYANFWCSDYFKSETRHVRPLLAF